MKKTYINKMLTALIAVALMTSIIAIINVNKPTTVSALWPPTDKPGVNFYGNATTDLVYGQTVQPYINTSWMSAATYFLYKPAYNCSGTGYRYASELNWYEQVLRTDTSTAVQLVVTTPGTIYQLSGPILLDRAGMWVFDDSDPSTIDGNDTNIFKSFFWVNTSQAYDIATMDSFDYGTNTSKTITVTESGSTPSNSVYIDLIRPDGTVAFHQYESDGIYSFGTYGNITMAGNYTIRSYADLDLYSSAAYLYYDEGLTGSYSNQYGKLFSAGQNTTLRTTGDNWNYSICGPWDPPERNATEEAFRVTTGTPSLAIPVGNQTMYWGFSGEVNITVKDASGDKIYDHQYCIDVYNEDDVRVNNNLTIINYDGYCHISNGTWGADNSYYFGSNGTWYAYIYVDTNGDRNTTTSNKEWNEEWNGTVEWKVLNAPGVQFKWIDDDASLSTNDNDGEIPYVPAVANVPVNIQFQIIGNDHTYYGATSQQEAMENITLTGNALFTGTLDKIPGVTYGSGTWTVPIVPTMNQGGGNILITATWEDYGSIEQALNIGGSNYLTNGTIVTITSGNSEFETGTDQTFTVQLKYADGTAITYGAQVYLYYIDDGEVASAGDPLQGHVVSQDLDGSNGYTLQFNKTQQTTNQTNAGLTIKAPRNLTIYAIAYVGSTPVYGYARIYMKAAHDLKVTFEAVDGSYPGTLLAGYKYHYFYINITKLDAAGNASGIPDADDYTQLTVQILDDAGNDVTTSIGSISASDIAATSMGNDYVYKLDNEYITTPGTYTVYAYNNTHDTTGHNATIEVKQAHVECDKAPFIWSYDDNISATFTVTSEITGERLNGTLRIENMSYKSASPDWYNKTYTNTTDAGNSTIDLDSNKGFVNGQVTVDDITADYLPPGVASRNITFWFRPKLSAGGNGEWAEATGIVYVQVPTVVPVPQYVAAGLRTSVTMTVTGRSTPLEGIFVGLHGCGVTVNGTSGSNGKITFSIQSTVTGNISIDVGEADRTVDTVIISTAWAIDISSPISVLENEEFTVTITELTSGDPVENCAVTITGIGSENTDANGQATFTAPEVSSDLSYTISATKEGYNPDTGTITVINVPKLIISVDESVAGGSSFDVVVAKDTGDPVIGATVTFNGKTYKTKAGGVASIPAPEVDSDTAYTLTASFGTFTEATASVTVTPKPSTPGFELLTLIVAIGVAFILLRRRQK